MPTLNWIGKEAVINHHDEVPIHTLTHDPDRSLGVENEPIGTGNLLIEGDNLLALKALLPYYAGKVKCIYIDPPYNTGNENWIYNDNVNNPTIRKWLGKTVGKLSEDLSRHDKWLCMMYPRLCLIHQFLREDGVIFISIDDNEVHHLRMLMDEIFGEKNFFAILTRRAMHTVRNSSKDFNHNADYTLVYAKEKSWFGEDKSRYIRYITDKSKKYPHDDNDGRGKYKLDPLSARNYYEPYTFTFENGVEWSPPSGRYPSYSQDTLRRMEREGRIDFSGNEPRAKRYLSEVQEGQPPDVFLSPEIVGFNKEGTTELRNIFGEGGVFPQPKPVKFIKFLLELLRSKDAIILDSFAGSGTTAHAVMEQNREDGGSRRFILVEVEPKIAREITAVRLERVSEGYTYEQKGRLQHVFGTEGTFSYYHVGETFLEKQEIPFSEMAQLLFFKETGTPMAVNTVVSLVEGDSPSYGACNAAERYKRAFLGSADGVGVYLLNSEDILTEDLIDHLPPHNGSRVIHCGGTQLTEATLKQLGITFRQMPYNLV
ncbi:site-specific DNA-methyltransferase [Candidatus Poribacteria bacterium]|nr:site-specific DNA-methyltransferase [Candidatus Poribacteria bacterium]MYK24940.1 site-specific DNA-methyltransferase [Candidatus Poribacteria bacterium]